MEILMELGMENSILQYNCRKEHSLGPFYFIVFTNNVLPSPDIVWFEQDLVVDIHQVLPKTKKTRWTFVNKQKKWPIEIPIKSILKERDYGFVFGLYQENVIWWYDTKRKRQNTGFMISQNSSNKQSSQ